MREKDEKHRKANDQKTTNANMEKKFKGYK